MTSRWAARLLIAVPITIIVILIARTYMRNRRIDYWTLAEGSNQPNDSNAQMRILFLGNSFIHYNGGAEKVVAGLLEESLGINVFARRYCPGGYTWQQHLEDAQDPKRSLYRLLGEGGKKHWDYIIFQEQSQAPALGGRDTQGSFEALQRLLEFVRARSSKQILLMTWGYLHGDPADHPAIFPDYHAMQERLTAGYYSLADRVRESLSMNVSVAPAGLAWQQVFRMSLGKAADELPEGKESFHALYYKDGIHPSAVGTYLESCVMASVISGCKSGGLKSNILGLSAAWRHSLQKIADMAVFEQQGSQSPGLLVAQAGCPAADGSLSQTTG